MYDLIFVVMSLNYKTKHTATYNYIIIKTLPFISCVT